jgi:nucleotide-binding universal stress UspA family protein
MIRTILFPTDGFAASDTAQKTAIELAERFHARIIGLGILDVPWLVRPETIPVGGTGNVRTDGTNRVEEADRRVSDALSRLQTAAAVSGVAVDVVAMKGEPLQVLKGEAHRCDLVVVGRGANFRSSFGERESRIVEALIREGPRPVLSVPETATGASRLLVAFDASNSASRAMHMTALLGLVQNAQVQVLSIDAHARIAEQHAELAASLLRTHGGEVTAFGVESDVDPGEMILSHARTFGAHIVIMGAYGHRGLRDTIFGSCTRHVMDNCTAALFVQY